MFYAQDARAISGFDENAPLVREMVDALVIGVTGQSDVESAWKALVLPSDRVGIKVSASGGRVFSTHKGIIDALIAGLARAGVPAQNIIVWDRADMTAAGFTETARGWKVRTVEPVTGYDAKAVFASTIEGKLIWGDVLFSRRKPSSAFAELEQLSGLSHWSKVLGEVSKIINVPVLTSAENFGVAGCLYNVTIPNIDNWRRFTRSASDPFLCELYRDKHVAPKVVLHLMDGLLAQYAGGPGEWQPSYAWRHATLYASKDPVALDATALREIEKWRAQAKLPSLVKRASYLQTAEATGLGNAAAERIELKPISTR